jgi:hypothetical protein
MSGEDETENLSLSDHDLHNKRTFSPYPAGDSSAVMPTPGNIVSSCILDLSKSGLAFCYNGKA